MMNHADGWKASEGPTVALAVASSLCFDVLLHPPPVPVRQREMR